jgi:hypothetical protein
MSRSYLDQRKIVTITFSTQKVTLPDNKPNVLSDSILGVFVSHFKNLINGDHLMIINKTYMSPLPFGRFHIDH